MQFKSVALLCLVSISSAAAFVGSAPKVGVSTAMKSSESDIMKSDIMKSVNYKPAGAQTDFAKKYAYLAGAQVKTVGQAFAEFTENLGFTVNALYKNMVTDIVGTTHLIVVNARFSRDPVWSLGLMTSLNLLLKNYPEKEVADRIVTALFECLGLDESEVKAEANMISEWAKGKSREDVEAALSGGGDSPLATIANGIKENEFWMYSRYFGIGLVKIMEGAGLEMDKDEVYPIMESWMTEKLGRSSLTACADSDLYFRISDKLEMMETLMKEIEIREKKRLAERLEEKAEQALRAAEREGKLAAEIEADQDRLKDVTKVDA